MRTGPGPFCPDPTGSWVPTGPAGSHLGPENEVGPELWPIPGPHAIPRPRGLGVGPAEGAWGRGVPAEGPCMLYISIYPTLYAVTLYI